VKNVLKAVQELPILVPFLQSQSLAITVCVKARVLKMAALYDMPLTIQTLEDEIFNPLGEVLLVADPNAKDELCRVCKRIIAELSSNVAEVTTLTSSCTPTPADGASTPAVFGNNSAPS